MLLWQSRCRCRKIIAGKNGRKATDFLLGLKKKTDKFPSTVCAVGSFVEPFGGRALQRKPAHQTAKVEAAKSIAITNQTHVNLSSVTRTTPSHSKQTPFFFCCFFFKAPHFSQHHHSAAYLCQLKNILLWAKVILPSRSQMFKACRAARTPSSGGKSPRARGGGDHQIPSLLLDSNIPSLLVLQNFKASLSHPSDSLSALHAASCSEARGVSIYSCINRKSILKTDHSRFFQCIKNQLNSALQAATNGIEVLLRPPLVLL